MERLVDIVTGWGVSNSLVVVIPHKLRTDRGFVKGDRFAVKTDEAGRIIYEALEG